MFSYRGFIAYETDHIVIQHDNNGCTHITQLDFPTVRDFSCSPALGDVVKIPAGRRDGLAIWVYNFIHNFIVATYGEMQDSITAAILYFKFITETKVDVLGEAISPTYAFGSEYRVVTTLKMRKNIANIPYLFSSFVKFVLLVYLQSTTKLSEVQIWHLASLDIFFRETLGCKNPIKLAADLVSACDDCGLLHLLKYPGNFIFGLKSSSDYDLYNPPLKQQFLEVVRHLKTINCEELKYFLKRAEYRILVISHLLTNEPKFTTHCRDDFRSIITAFSLAADEYEKRVNSANYVTYPFKIDSLFDLIDACVNKHDDILFRKN
jgi:hypothetical protein